MQEKFRAKGKKLYFGFVDLEKVFDGVPGGVTGRAVCGLGGGWCRLSVCVCWCGGSFGNGLWWQW